MRLFGPFFSRIVSSAFVPSLMNWMSAISGGYWLRFPKRISFLLCTASFHVELKLKRGRFFRSSV